MILLVRLAVAVFIFLSAMAYLPTAQAVADDFYKGKTVTIVVGFTPGGGYDRYARTLARYFGRYIPGNPTVIVQNMSGAGSLTSVRYLDATAARDGTVIVTFNSNLVTQAITSPEKVKLDFSSYRWVGVITGDYRVCYAWGATNIKTWNDMMQRKEFILGASAKGDGDYINGVTLQKVFNAPVRLVMGFPGSAENRLAIERGELDGGCGSWSSLPEGWINDGKINTLALFSPERLPKISESAVYIRDLANTQGQKDVLDILAIADEIGRPLIMSGKVTAERTKIIQNAFDASMKDKEFLADAEKQKLPVNPLTGEEAEKIIAKMSTASPAAISQVKAIYGE
jgi:tripartite-type tricarboxylate transporter receptor subunit TctC